MGNNMGRIYYSRNVVNLCIDDYDVEKQCGKLWSQYAGEPVAFSSLFEALGQMEELYDSLRYPYASTEMRSFLENGGSRRGMEADLPKWQGAAGEPRLVESFKELISHRGRDATFIIRVQYRQHSSWQGEIVWVDGQKRHWFGSVLELARLIDNALEGTGERVAAGRTGEEGGYCGEEGFSFRGGN